MFIVNYCVAELWTHWKSEDYRITTEDAGGGGGGGGTRTGCDDHYQPLPTGSAAHAPYQKMAGVSGTSSLAQTLMAIKSKVDSCLKDLSSGEGAALEEKGGVLSTLEKAALGDLSKLPRTHQKVRASLVYHDFVHQHGPTAWCDNSIAVQVLFI